MDTFGFTKKKFLSLSIENQNRQVINWLSGFYQKLITNRLTPAGLDLFIRHYNEILNWTGRPCFIRPASDHPRAWIEAVSDRIHHLRCKTGRTVRDHDLLENVQTMDLSELLQPVEFNCHVALDGLRSLYNVGSIFRTCEAAGFDSILLGNTPGKDHPGVQKTSMGAHQWMEQEKVIDLAQTLIEKKKHGFTIIGVETIKGACPFHDFPWHRNTIVVFGNEEYGISSHVLKTCDAFVHIPMFGRKNSINVANAVSVICFHIACMLSEKKSVGPA